MNNQNIIQGFAIYAAMVLVILTICLLSVRSIQYFNLNGIWIIAFVLLFSVIVATFIVLGDKCWKMFKNKQ